MSERESLTGNAIGSMNAQDASQNWFIPLSAGTRTLAEARLELQSIGLKQSQVPLMVQLVENPKYDLPGFDIFHGATSIETHDCIHIILGRGLLAKDEAFVIGFTMGSTDRVSTTEERLYAFFAKYLYPRDYRFGDDEIRVFKDAVKLGFVSDCQSLSKVDYSKYLDWPLARIRAALGIEEDLLRAYYAIEKRRYPSAPESQRLLS
jgi:hypothetical protein